MTQSDEADFEQHFAEPPTPRTRPMRPMRWSDIAR